MSIFNINKQPSSSFLLGLDALKLHTTLSYFLLLYISLLPSLHIISATCIELVHGPNLYYLMHVSLVVPTESSATSTSQQPRGRRRRCAGSRSYSPRTKRDWKDGSAGCHYFSPMDSQQSSTAKTTEIDAIRFQDKDLLSAGTLDYGQFGVVRVLRWLF